MFEGFALRRWWASGPGVHNEDDYHLAPDLGLAVLSSGHGAIGTQGMPAAVLAQWSVAGHVEHAGADEEPSRVLEAGVARANDAVRRLSNDWPEGLGRPSSDLAVVLARGREALLLNMGCSRIWRARDGELELLLGPSPSADLLTRSLASMVALGRNEVSYPRQRTVDTRPGDTFLLAPASLLRFLGRAQLIDMLTAPGSVESAVTERLDALRRAGGHGQTSACVIRLGSPASARSSGSPRPAISWLFDPGRPLADPPRRYDAGPDPAWFREVYALVVDTKSEPPEM